MAGPPAQSPGWRPSLRPPGAAIIIGCISAVACYYAIVLVKLRLKIDDSLDVFAVHGVGGIIGSLLLAVLAAESLGGIGYAEGSGMGDLVVAQLIGVGSVVLYSAVVTAILALMVSVVFPMRVSDEDERDGLDIASHGERAWELD